MVTRNRGVGLLTLALVLLPAAVASAAPDFNATLSGASPRFTWESTGTGVPDLSGGSARCTGAPFTCEYVLFDVRVPGELTLTLDMEAACSDSPCSGVNDINGNLYRSNAAGEPQSGIVLTRGCATNSSTVQTCRAAVAPGFYVFEIEYWMALEARYLGTAELAPGPAPPVDETVIALEGCNFTLYYFKDSAERVRPYVPPGYRVRPYSPFGPWVADTEGSATIAAAAYDCDRIGVPGSPTAPGIVTLLSVLVYTPQAEEEVFEGPARSDFYALWIHASNPHLTELLASGGIPAHLVPDMSFEKLAQSLAVRVVVPWSLGSYELGATGFGQDILHSHANSYWHDAADSRLARLDFVTTGARDQYCTQQSDDHAIQCGTLTAQAGTPVASLFGGAQRSADNAWDHDPLQRAEFHLSVCHHRVCRSSTRPQPHSHPSPPAILRRSGPLRASAAAASAERATARRRGLRVGVRCSVQCTSAAVATVDRSVARRLGLGERSVRIARGTRAITRAGRLPVLLELSPRTKTALARGDVKRFAVKVGVTVTDRHGGQLKRMTRTITLR